MPDPPLSQDPLAQITRDPSPVKPAPAVDVDQGPAPIDSVRVTFYDEVQQRCFIFAQDLLTLVPELESVAVVPVYGKPSADIPAAILVGRNGPPKTAVEVMHMSGQMHRAQQHLLKHAAEFLTYVDQELATSISRLHDVRKELEDLNAERDAKATERAATSGATPEGAGPSGDPPVGPADDR